MAHHGSPRSSGMQERFLDLLDEFVTQLDGSGYWEETDLAQQAALLDDVESTLESVLRRHVRGVQDFVVDFGELARAQAASELEQEAEILATPGQPGQSDVDFGALQQAIEVQGAAPLASEPQRMAAAPAPRAPANDRASPPASSHNAMLERMLTQIARKMNQRADQARELFLSFDTLNTGVLTNAEFFAGISSLGIALSAAEKRAVMAYFDRNRSGSIDYEEFLQVFEFARGGGAPSRAQSTSHTAHSRVSADASREVQHDAQGGVSVPAAIATRRLAMQIRRRLLQWRGKLSDLFLSIENTSGKHGVVSLADMSRTLHALRIFASVEDLRQVFNVWEHLTLTDLAEFLAAGGRGVDLDAAVPYPQQAVRDPEAEAAAAMAARAYRYEAPEESDGDTSMKHMQHVDNVVRQVASTMREHNWKFNEVFERFNTYGDGSVSCEELVAGMRTIGIVLTRATATKLISQFDVNGDGQLQKFEFLRMLHTVQKANEAHAAGDSTALQHVKAAISSKMHGVVSRLSDYIYGGGRKVREVFRRLDANGNRRVGVEEFIDGLLEIGVDIGTAEAEALLAQFDDDGDGQINLSGFMRMLAAQPDERL